MLWTKETFITNQGTGEQGGRRRGTGEAGRWNPVTPSSYGPSSAHVDSNSPLPSPPQMSRPNLPALHHAALVGRCHRLLCIRHGQPFCLHSTPFTPLPSTHSPALDHAALVGRGHRLLLLCIWQPQHLPTTSFAPLNLSLSSKRTPTSPAPGRSCKALSPSSLHPALTAP